MSDLSCLKLAPPSKYIWLFFYELSILVFVKLSPDTPTRLETYSISPNPESSSFSLILTVMGNHSDINTVIIKSCNTHLSEFRLREIFYLMDFQFYPSLIQICFATWHSTAATANHCCCHCQLLPLPTAAAQLPATMVHYRCRCWPLLLPTEAAADCCCCHCRPLQLQMFFFTFITIFMRVSVSFFLTLTILIISIWYEIRFWLE